MPVQVQEIKHVVNKGNTGVLGIVLQPLKIGPAVRVIGHDLAVQDHAVGLLGKSLFNLFIPSEVG